MAVLSVLRLSVSVCLSVCLFVCVRSDKKSSLLYIPKIIAKYVEKNELLDWFRNVSLSKKVAARTAQISPSPRE